VARPTGELMGTTPLGSDLLKSLKHGARHYFHPDKPALPDRLVRSLLQSVTGQVKLSNHCTAKFATLEVPGAVSAPIIGIEFFSDSRPSTVPALTLLTTVERDIYERICTGAATNRQIAHARGTSPATVKNQVSEVLRKLGVTHRNELIAAHPYQPQLPVTAPSSDSSGTKGRGAQR
jgi:DNA-binding NarL/FixJ family response regulator